MLQHQKRLGLCGQLSFVIRGQIPERWPPLHSGGCYIFSHLPFPSINCSSSLFPPFRSHSSRKTRESLRHWTLTTMSAIFPTGQQSSWRTSGTTTIWMMPSPPLLLGITTSLMMSHSCLGRTCWPLSRLPIPPIQMRISLQNPANPLYRTGQGGKIRTNLPKRGQSIMPRANWRWSRRTVELTTTGTQAPRSCKSCSLAKKTMKNQGTTEALLICTGKFRGEWYNVKAPKEYCICLFFFIPSPHTSSCECLYLSTDWCGGPFKEFEGSKQPEAVILLPLYTDTQIRKRRCKGLLQRLYPKMRHLCIHFVKKVFFLPQYMDTHTKWPHIYLCIHFFLLRSIKIWFFASPRTP